MRDECGVLYCIDFDDVAGKPKCCNSCHDDVEEGYHELLERYDDSASDFRVTHMVCCTVNTWLDGKL